MKEIPTIRSQFNIEQFRFVLQQHAHEIAKDAIANLQGDIRIDAHGGRLSYVETSRYTIRFSPVHISYSEESGRSYVDWWGFDVEEKFYATSSDSTKISFPTREGKTKETIEKITQFIDKLMAEAEMKPVPRFSLENITKKANPTRER